VGINIVYAKAILTRSSFSLLAANMSSIQMQNVILEQFIYSLVCRDPSWIMERLIYWS